jgi:hypothetical protein
MRHETVVDETTGRKFYLDEPDEPSSAITLVLSLHGGGSVGRWQHAYFPIHELADSRSLVVATPSAATKEPFRRWDSDADDAHLRAVVDQVVERVGAADLASFWLAGHSQGSLTSRRLLDTEWFAERVDGWLSLSGGRIGGVEMAPDFGRHGARTVLVPPAATVGPSGSATPGSPMPSSRSSSRRASTRSWRSLRRRHGPSGSGPGRGSVAPTWWTASPAASTTR